MRQLLAFAIVVALFAGAWVAIPKLEARPRADTNLVFVIACTLRADQTSLGRALDSSPTLARWGEEGAWFADVVAAAPWTRAASTALLTGRTPSALGVSDPGPGLSDRGLPDDAVTLAETLADAGWLTLGVTANPNLNPEFHFDQGFSRYTGLSELWRRGLTKVPGEQVLAEAARLLDEADPSRPTYLQLVFVDTHGPEDATAAERAPFEADGIPDQVAAYRAMVHRLDGHLAALEAMLADRGLTPDNTTFVVVGDHGEGLLFPPSHAMGHGLFLYPSTVHVPWVVYGRGVPSTGRIDGLASGVDVAPTTAALVGAALDGHSHAAALTGADTGRDVAYTATWFRQARRAAAYTPTVACLRDFSPELPAHPTQDKPPFPTGCFDRRDPAFTDPIAPRPDLDAGLQAWFAAEETALLDRAPVHGEVGSDLQEALEALGYVGD